MINTSVGLREERDEEKGPRVRGPRRRGQGPRVRGPRRRGQAPRPGGARGPSAPGARSASGAAASGHTGCATRGYPGKTADGTLAGADTEPAWSRPASAATGWWSAGVEIAGTGRPAPNGSASPLDGRPCSAPMAVARIASPSTMGRYWRLPRRVRRARAAVDIRSQYRRYPRRAPVSAGTVLCGRLCPYHCPQGTDTRRDNRAPGDVYLVRPQSGSCRFRSGLTTMTRNGPGGRSRESTDAAATRLGARDDRCGAAER